VLLALALWREGEEPIPWALGVLAAAYAATLFVHRGSVDEGAPLVAAGLLLCGELAAWSLDARGRIRAEQAVLQRRIAALAALLLAGLAASSAVVLTAGANAGRGLAWTTLGAASAVAVVAAAVVLLRRTSSRTIV